MSTPRSIRFELSTLARLESYAARHPGLSVSSAAALLTEEGLRMDAHPGILFRDGPTGRRAGLAAGPDVWEIIRSILSAKGADPSATPEALAEIIGENTGLSTTAISIAVNYYASYPDEIDAQLRAAEDAEREAEVVLARTHELLGL